MSKGTVTYFNEYKGWGIISDPNVEKDIFVHYTKINMDGYRTLKPGQEVTFELAQTRQGPCAHNVNLAE